MFSPADIRHLISEHNIHLIAENVTVGDIATHISLKEFLQLEPPLVSRPSKKKKF